MSLSAQVACIKRELAMRERVYPSLIARGKMKRSTAEYEFRPMRAALRTLEGLAADCASPKQESPEK